MRTNTRHFLIQWLSLLSLLLLLGVALAYSLWHHRQQIENSEANQLLASCRTIQLDTERYLTTIHQTLGQLSKIVARGGAGDLNAQLATLVGAMPAVRTINIHDAAATIRWTSRPELLGLNVDFAKRDYFRIPQENPDPEKLYISPPFNTITGVYTLALSRVVIDQKGKFAGVVVATLDPEHFATLLDSIRYAPDMVASLQHSDGTLLMMSPPPEEVIGVNLVRPGSVFLRHRESGRASTVFSGTLMATGEARMIAQMVMRPAGINMDQGLGVATSRLLSEIYDHWHWEASRIAGFFTFFALLACVGLFLCQRKSSVAPPLGLAGTEPPYRFFSMAAVFLLSLAFAAIGGWLLHLDNNRVGMAMAHEAERLKTAYEASQAELEHQLTVLAKEIAMDAEVIRLLALANNAPPEQFSRLHDQLRQYLAPRWQNLQQAFDARQMQAVLPGSVSFLRLHLPEDYGDSLKGVRHLLDEVERTSLPHSGFETGRIFSGLRGAAPVLQKSPGGDQRYLGAIEIGIHFDGHIARIGKQTGVGYGVLLKLGMAREIMWESKKTLLGGQDGNLLLTASSGELAGWVSESRLPPYNDHPTSGFITEHGRTFQIIRFPLAEFSSKLAPTPPIGSIVIWHEVTDRFAANHRYQWQTVFYVALAYVFSLTLLVLLLRASRQEWQRQVDAKAADLARLTQQKKVLLEALGEGVYGVDLHGHATFINATAQRLLGFSSEQIIGQNQHLLFHHHRPDGSEYPGAECPVRETLDDGLFRSREEWFIRANGEGFPVRLTVAAVEEDGERSGAVVVFRDISEQKHKEAELLRLATTDPLTGVANRRQFLEQLTQEIGRFQRSGEPAALMMLDLDLFKLVNDNYGHAAGDLVLQRLASLAGQTLRRIDMVGRLGGEEFAVLLPGSNLAAALEAGERLRKALEAEIIHSKAGEIRITTSIGITLLKPDDEEPDQPLSRADEALYVAKYQGRNRVEYRQ